jgi:hypothetical protein
VAANDYHFVTRWRVQGSAAEIFEIISRAEDLPRWWPSVYLRADVLETRGPGGVGDRVRLLTKGWLPYTLTWEFIVTDVERPRRLALSARGDVVGTGVWTFADDTPHVDITFEWRVRADKPLLRLLSPLLKPIFSANHRWAMDRGVQSLELELRRRRTTDPIDLARIPPPPPPTFLGR